ncbi:MAG: AtpZ/AtpI family protein [Sphingobacteriaceae bacterium]|nr:AtpZ/AtpI family protein [Sphingobacteriaceae bacterium]
MTEPEKNNQIKEASNFAKYTGVAFQMLATIGLMAFIGYKIDENRGSKQQIFTAIFGLIGVIVSLVQVVRSLNKDK